MKKIIFAVIVTAAIGMLAGCSSQQTTPSGNPANSINSATVAATQNVNPISMEEAKTKAVTDAGFKADEVKYAKSNIKMVDGVQRYEIEFTANGKKYNYEIESQSGLVMQKSQAPDK